MKTAVYPGSFDPITCGHLDIIRRASRQFDHIIIAVLNNTSKKPMFTAEERVELIKKSIADLPNCSAEAFDGLLVDFVRAKNSRTVIKGLRALSDFEYEFQMALFNKKMEPDIETLFMATDANASYISSSIVKEIASLDGDFRDLVPEEIYDDVKLKMKEGR